VQRPSKPLWLALASFALVVGMGAFSSAAAQNYPKAAVGYQFVHSGATGTNLSLPVGWFVDVSFPIDLPMLTALLSADGSYRSEGGDKLHTYMGGARYTLEPRGRITPHVQALFGIARFSDDLGADTKSVVDVGGGINYELNQKWTFRLGADYRRRTSDPAANQFRVNLGVVFGIGG
jgi:hypothetical protein